MIVVDANLLVYAYNTVSDHHEAARGWLDRAFSGSDQVCLPWQSIAAFLRIVTNPKLNGLQFSLTEAQGIVDSWIMQPNVRVLGPTDDHWFYFRRVIQEGRATGSMISDAEIAALTIEYGGVLHTNDRDFARFPGLRWVNPLQS